MAVALAQMNIRLESDTKSMGDAVLEDYGLSPTAAVRALWSYLATHRTLPDFLAQVISSSTSQPTSSQLAEEGCGLAAKLAAQSGLDCTPLQTVSYAQLQEWAFEERLAESLQAGEGAGDAGSATGATGAEGVARV